MMNHDINYRKIETQHLSIYWFQLNLYIRSLSLKQLKIQSIQPNAFNTFHFKELIELKIENVMISNLPKGIFEGLSKMKNLFLKNLKIINIDKNVLKPVPFLESFSMSSCGIGIMKLDPLFGSVKMLHLTKVIINNCTLKDTITETTFSGLSVVSTLNLTNNQIEVIGPKSFDIVLNTLKILILQSNKLKTLPNDLFKNMKKSATTINLIENQWHCDCNLEHLRQLLRSAEKSFSPIACQTPLKLKSVYLKYVGPFCDGSVTTEVLNELELNSFANQVELTLIADDQALPSCASTNVTIAMEKGNNFPIIRLENAKLFIEVQHFSSIFGVIGFDENKKMTHCMESTSNGNEKFDISSILAANRLQHFCLMKIGSKFISPSNCVTIYLLNLNEKHLTKHPKTVVAFLLCIFGGIVSGILMTIFFNRAISQINLH